MKRMISLILALSLLCAGGLAGCTPEQSTDLMETYRPNAIQISGDPKTGISAAADFSVELFQHSVSLGGNTLISPMSVLVALSMTANGADGQTLAQMEQVLGTDVQTLNCFLYEYLNRLPDEEKCALRFANSLWFKDAITFEVNPIFLQTNADYYRAGIYKAPFDESTRDEINNWVKENTDGMIPGIVDQIPEAAVMYLINALAFDAQWATIYTENQISDGIFHLMDPDGTTRSVEMMYSTEGLYLEDGDTIGFIKPYSGGTCAFVALLPPEGMSVEEYAATLTGEKLLELLSNPKQCIVNAGIPKFQMSYGVEMSNLLKSMGMEDAFRRDKADFSRLGQSSDGNLVINRVLHKSFIALDEKGTKAGAATSVEVNAPTSLAPVEKETVILDRPFVYLLIDFRTNLPFFMGTMTDPAQTEHTPAVPEIG